MAYYPLAHMDQIAPRPVLLITGEKAETRKFSQQAYDNAQQPKELMVILAHRILIYMISLSLLIRQLINSPYSLLRVCN